MKSNTTRILAVLVGLMLIMGIAACGTQAAPAADTAKTIEATATASSAASTVQVTEPAKQVTIKFADNQPDQTNGMGKLIKQLTDAYMKENTNVKVEFELNENETHRQKMKIYAASNNMPDLFMYWADPSALIPLAKAGYVAELNAADYKDDNFVAGALEDCSYQGKIYGLPRNYDIWLMMYNQALFEQNGIKVPTTIGEMLEAGKAFRAKGITPCVMNGKELWNESVLTQDLMIRTSGNNTDLVPNALSGKTTFAKEKSAVDAMKLLKQMADDKFFQDGYMVADYATAQNLFTQEKAAMYYIGSWELGLGSNTELSDSFKKNVRAMFMPTLEGAPDTSRNVAGRTGGIYALNPSSKVKDEALKLLNYIFLPDNWAKQAWQQGVCTPAQKWDSYMTGNETVLQKDITNIFAQAKTTSGFFYAYKLTPAFQDDCLNNIAKVLANQMTPEEYWQSVDASAVKNPIQ